MIKFLRHVPAYVDVRGPLPVNEFESVQELLESLNSDSPNRTFSHWAWSDGYLMGVWDSGLHWWVMGSTKPSLEDVLPKWESRYVAEINGAPVVLDGSEVASSCGGDLTLVDGSVVKNLYR